MSKKNKKAKNKKTQNKEINAVQGESSALDFEGVEFSVEAGDPLLALSDGTADTEKKANLWDAAEDIDDNNISEEAANAEAKAQTADDVNLEMELGAQDEFELEAAFEEQEEVSDEDSMAVLAEEENEDEPVAEVNENGETLELVQLTDDEAVSVIESLLFISDRPVGMTTFKNAFVGTNVTTKKIKTLIAELQGDLAQTRRGVSLEEVDGAFQLRTKVDNQIYIKKIIKARVFKLTGPSLETLAVIAYKQPCIKADVDEVRGVESGHLVRALMDKGLVAFAGKSDLPGKPMFYKTTRKFLEIFGLRNINELPTLKEMEELLPEGIGEEEEKETLSDLTGKLSENYEGNYSVAEDELGKITEQLAGISTNTEFFEEEKRKQKEKQDRERAEALQEAVALGDEVDPKDLKWLEKYEAKLAAELEQAEASAAQADVSHDPILDDVSQVAGSKENEEPAAAVDVESASFDSATEDSTLEDLAFATYEDETLTEELEESEESDPLDLL